MMSAAFSTSFAAGVAKLLCRHACGAADGLWVVKFGDYAVRWRFAKSVAGHCNLQLGLPYQRVAELAFKLHGCIRYGAAAGRDKVHQAKADGGNAGVLCNGVGVVQPQRRFY